MIKKVFELLRNYFGIALIAFFALGLAFQPAVAQSDMSSQDEIKPLRSDVGLHGLTANLHWLNDVTYKGNDTLRTDGSSELEFVYRNVRMMMPRLGVGFQVLTSFYVDGPESSFGVGSWGVGPVIRAYPFKTDRFQPYVQLNSLFGNNMALGNLANTQSFGDGFRVRFGARAGIAFRLTNSIGIFTEVGYDWESGRIFKADARALQANIGFDFYMFN